MRKSGDQTWLISIAKSIINIQELYGTIPNIHIQGSCSKVTLIYSFKDEIFKIIRYLFKAVYELIERINSLDNSTLSKTNYDYKIGHLILVDRSAYQTIFTISCFYMQRLFFKNQRHRLHNAILFTVDLRRSFG
jgi:hypothetical protein